MVWSWYVSLLARRPLLTTAFSTGALMGTGDILAQQVVDQRGWKNHDVARTARMAAFGLCFTGPLLRGWYKTLDKMVTFKDPRKAALGKMVADQALFAPFIIFSFFGGLGKLEGKSNEEIKKQVETDYPRALLANYKIWPAIQMINFYFTPLHHRPLVVNTASLFWNTYLAWLAHSNH